MSKRKVSQPTIGSGKDYGGKDPDPIWTNTMIGANVGKPKSCWNCKGTNLFIIKALFQPTFKRKRLTVRATTTYCDSCGQHCMNDKQMDKFLIATKAAYLAYKLEKRRARGASK